MGTVFKIKKYALHDGPGIRTTVFLKGCPLKCWWCHNPEGQRCVSEVMRRGDTSRAKGAGSTGETVGWQASADEIVDEIEKDVIFYDESGGGATFSGGEPLLQSGFLMELLGLCAEREIHAAVDTTGYAPREVLEKVMGRSDLFLFDLKMIDEEAHIRYTGVSNDIILENLRFLSGEGARLRIRFPLIPGINDHERNLDAMSDYIRSLSASHPIDILPYHRIGMEKHGYLGKDYKLKDTAPPGDDRVGEVRSMFESCGFTVNVGG